MGVDVAGVGRDLAARDCEPLAPPRPDPDPDAAAPRLLPVDTPRELEERFEPGFRGSVDAWRLEVLLSSSCFLL